MTTYQAMGTRVLLRVLPQEESSIVLPQGAQRGGLQRFQVESIGGLVNQEGFVLEIGSVVQLTNHPNIVGIDQTGPFIAVDRSDIAVVVFEKSVEG